MLLKYFAVFFSIFQKEDVEAALRSREMNRDEAQELLNQVRPLDQWRRHEAHSGYELANQATSGPSYPRFNHVAQQMSFPPVSLNFTLFLAEHLSWWKLAIKYAYFARHFIFIYTLQKIFLPQSVLNCFSNCTFFSM